MTSSRCVIPTQVTIAALIGAFSILGAFSRLMLARVDVSENVISLPLTAVMYPNFYGCLILGFLKELPVCFESISSNTQLMALINALGTGFCGALTSFGSLLWDEMTILFKRDRKHKTELLLGHVFLSYATALSAYSCGRLIVRVIYIVTSKIYESKSNHRVLEISGVSGTSPKSPGEKRTSGVSFGLPQTPHKSVLSSSRVSKSTTGIDGSYMHRSSAVGISDDPPDSQEARTNNDEAVLTLSSLPADQSKKTSVEFPLWASVTSVVVFLILFIASFTVGLVLYKDSDRLEDVCDLELMSSALAPFGAITRWVLSRYNNDNFKTGTLVANLVGTFLTCVMNELPYIFEGMGDSEFDTAGFVSGGLLGSLSTMSTYISELKSMDSLSSLLYFLATHVTAFIISLIVTLFARLMTD
eukprot:GHVH01004050.1.p1 GENE.GHVH01004050.1~~GHVH01004050.1.p1  ORF type:complete len:415 (+),score=46.88 GHVH01004050.1:145-1389(+)